MDVLITFAIILIIGLAVAPFFLLSGQFQPKKKDQSPEEGAMVPVPLGVESPFFPMRERESTSDDDEYADNEDGDDIDSDR